MNNKYTINKHIMTLVTYVFLVPLVYFIPAELNRIIKMTKLMNVFLSVGIIVLLMSYLIIPLFKKGYILRRKMVSKPGSSWLKGKNILR